MRLDEFDFELPAEAIATEPCSPRDRARLLVHDRTAATSWHTTFARLADHLRPGDLLVVNDTRVLPWRLVGRRPTGGRVDVLIVGRDAAGFTGYLKPARRVKPGDTLELEGGVLLLHATADRGGGLFAFALTAPSGDGVDAVLERHGRAPLPPYVSRPAVETEAQRAADREHYQTLFAARPGAIAAPTAGLHFTPEVLAELDRRGIERAAVTLHVGAGTFAPVRVDEVEQHTMHAERYELPGATAEAVARARARGRRVVAVGTTSARTLETCARPGRTVAPGSGETSLFLFPGRDFRVVDALLTNFHLPRSTLLMLVAAFAGRERVLALYRDAIARGYRFYSFGDAMLLL